MRRAMFGQPSLAHPAEMGGVLATWHPHSWDHHGRDQHDDTDDEQHVVLAERDPLPAYDDRCTSPEQLSVRLCTAQRLMCAFGDCAFEPARVLFRYATSIHQSRAGDGLGFGGMC